MCKLTWLLLSMLLFIPVSCQKDSSKQTMENEQQTMLKEKIKQYADVIIHSDLSDFSERDRILIEKLVEAGEIADKIFWEQSAHDALSVLDSLKALGSSDVDDYIKYVKINFGPYDPLDDNKRFVGEGPEKRPLVGGFYPEDLTKAEFEAYIKTNPNEADALKSEYTIVKRKNGKLIAVPYYKAYAESEALAEKLIEASEYVDNESLKKYLLLRAEAIRSDNYYESDLAWMDVKDSNIDIVIGPIENYQDELYNYKTAHEAVVMVRDKKASEELNRYIENMNKMEQMLPIDNKYKNKSVGLSNVIQVVNVVYFGGDCQQAVKTIAAVLPNDPRVADAKGRKISLYINHMEAKFNKIVIPIGETLLAPEISEKVDAKAFSGFVTLHEVSHALGPRYVFPSTDTEVRHALKESYSAIEECKADILSMYNHRTLNQLGVYSDEYLEKAKATYLAGLYRSIRFGSGAHYNANLIQLNYLHEQGAIYKNEYGKLTIKHEIFFDKVAELAELILMIQANGDYDKAKQILEKYAIVTDAIKSDLETLKHIPRDIHTEYHFH